MVEQVFLGYDPGGAGANGAAILRVPVGGAPSGAVTTLGSVDEVLDWFRSSVGKADPEATGIDTMLSWATGQSGWRPMDLHLRMTYPSVQHSVFSSNSAAGSMAVQGMAMALRLRQVWSDIQLNETHPKVLYFALTQIPYSFGQPMITWLTNMIGMTNSPVIGNDHEWDALISAWATWQGQSGTWATDLMAGVQGILLPAGSVTYFWP